MEDVNKSQQAAWNAADVKIDVDDVGSKTTAAMGVLKTVSTLLMSLESAPEVMSASLCEIDHMATLYMPLTDRIFQVLHQLETTLLPVFAYTLENICIGIYIYIYILGRVFLR